MKSLLNVSMKDGSRHFLSLPESYPWESFRDHLAKLAGVEVREFVTDHVTEVWIDFSFEGHAFSINNQFGEFWFFVSDPDCLDSILEKVATHSEAFLKTSPWLGRTCPSFPDSVWEQEGREL